MTYIAPLRPGFSMLSKPPSQDVLFQAKPWQLALTEVPWFCARGALLAISHKAMSDYNR